MIHIKLKFIRQDLKRKINTAAMISACWLALPASAEPERLLTFATLKSVEGSIGTAEQAETINAKAAAIGFTANPETVTNFSLAPVLSYSHNINGGNKPEPLTVGSIVFNGDPANYKKEGIITGLNATQSARLFYGHGRYLDASVTAGSAYSFEHDLALANVNLHACNINHLSNWWFLDICGDKAMAYRDLTQSQATTQSISLSRFLKTSDGAFSQLRFGAQEYKTDDYAQNQLVVGIDTFAPSGTYTAFDVTFGAPIQNELTTEFGFKAEVSTFIKDHPVSVSFSYENNTGGLFFSQTRNETHYSITATLPISQQVTASVGYSVTDSTIDYFDSAAPTFGLSFAPLKF